MPLIRSVPPRLKNLFLEGFTVMDVAEPLVSFDGDHPAERVRELMAARDFDLVGVREHGVVAGFARRTDLTSGLLSEFLNPFTTDDLVSESASLIETVHSLEKNRRCFVTVLGSVSAIVTLSDLEKPPVRMWLFGFITIGEMVVTQVIRENFPEERWREAVSGGRLARATELMVERRRRNQNVDLLDCLQYSDKVQILLQDDHYRAEMGIDSRTRGRRMLKQLETLRNHLAHSQDIVSENWEVIVQVALRLEMILGMS